MMNKSIRHSRAGFTLVELMAVIVVMAILGSIVLGIAGYAGRRAAESKAHAELQSIRNAMEEYRLHFGRYPDQIFETSANWSNWLGTVNHPLTNQLNEMNWLDPWGNAYQYEARSRFSYELFSHGPSGPDEDYDRIR